VRAGAKLDAPAKTRLSAINQQLAGLFTKFSQNVLADEADSVLVLKTDKDLGGLPASLREAAKTTATTRQILQLRAERAKLLGYKTHAHLRLDNTMAKTPEAAMQLMLDMWKPAVARVHEEVADMLALAKKEGAPADFKIEPWDYRYYAEKV
nr:probable cytosolic oligopeptidase A [Tanacetum cinerariifolium]